MNATQKLINYAVTVRKHNQTEWMEGFKKRIEDYMASENDSNIVSYNGDGFYFTKGPLDNEVIRKLFNSVSVRIVQGKREKYTCQMLAKDMNIHWLRVNRFMVRNGDNFTLSEKSRAIKALNRHNIGEPLPYKEDMQPLR